MFIRASSRSINAIKSHFRTTIRTSHTRRVVLIVFLLLLFLIRYNIITLFYITQTFFVWDKFTTFVINSKDHFDNTMISYPLDQVSAEPNYTDLVPAILHHIVIGDIDLKQRPAWLNARQACLKWHPNYEYRLWNDSSAEELIKNEYPWLLETWRSYTYPIQRADSLRYLVLYRYGGIFLDMDLHCRRSLGPLRRFEFVSPAAYPVGISNGFLMTSAKHPFIKALVDQLPLFNRNFLLPYATVMFSTGCMYLSAQYSLHYHQYNLRILDYDLHRLSGRTKTPLFQHDGSSSWHAGDASFIRAANAILKILFPYRYQIIFLLCIIFITIAFIVHRKRIRQRDNVDPV
jgi:inositol phosphorylceramide mannosyltransferase catalytic subunit